MDLLNLILDPLKTKATCFLCFTQNENSTCVYETFEIIDKYFVNTISVKDMMKKLFPFHDMLLAQACEKCIDIIIQIYTILQRNYYKRSALNKIIDVLTEGISKKTTIKEKTLKIYMKLPEYDNIESTLLDYQDIELKKSNDNLQKLYKKPDLDSREFVSTLSEKHKTFSHKHKNKNKATICDKCGKVCTTPKSLKSHLNCHIEKQCPYCLKTLKTHGNFNLHLKRHFTNTKQKRNKIYYKCHDCGYQSLNKKSLEAHINKIHLFIKPFICQICSKGFYKKSTMTEHEKTHHNTKNITCEVCGENFVSNKTLYVHLKLHSDVKMYKCQTCGKKFVTSGQRLEHFRRIHMEKLENCLICGKMFGLKKDLNRHLKKVHPQNVVNSESEIILINQR